MVKNLPILGSSYKEALKILSDRYDNEFTIIQDHLNALLDYPAMSKPNISMLRSLISQTKQHLSALKNLGESIEAWDNFLICLLVKKLDAHTTKAFHVTHNLNNKSLKPTYDMLMQFLESRALALENSG